MIKGSRIVLSVIKGSRICNSYNTGTCVLLDIYALAQTTSGTLKIYPNLMIDAQPLYIVTDTGCDFGTLF